MTDTSRRRARIALIVPSSNTVMENDLHRGLPADRYTVHTDRMYLIETTREAEVRMIEEFAKPAASDLGTLNPDLLVFGCTSAGSLFGLDYDARVCAELGELAGCPAMGVINAASEALDGAGARRLAVITPYIDDLTRSVATALSEKGREVVAAHGMGISVNVELSDPTPEDIVRFAAERLDGVSFDTLFVSCTNFRALEAREALAAHFGVPVLTSNSTVIDAIRKRVEASVAA
ncbi:Asp/Glu racemase [Acuticoccus sediminis]|uniref:Asp/Glu racemase n=1 Tax=Acuticoccus sediminis TaxID=2184697 RepID=A0A8B2NZD6_9HYPH|nr:aspartate/glutamate racemase family protein [Acuticoccus sediminis]RAI01920.1 Asp/Glu racemase [Acuticoccus sediminis]